MGEFLGQLWAPLAQVLGIAQGAAGGGLAALITQLESAGLQEHVESWTGEGENMAVTEEELEAAFGAEQLNDWALQAGTTPEAVLSLLSQELPGAVGRAT